MHDKIPRFFLGNGISAGLLHWPFSCGMRLPTGFLRAAPLNGRDFCFLGNILVCEYRSGNPRTALRRRGKSSRVPLCAVSADAEFCPPDKHSDPSPENRSVARPFSRYSLAWCSRDRPPSVAVFYSSVVLGDPLLAITAWSRWPPLSPRPPQSIHARHPSKSARCNRVRNPCQTASSPVLADHWCSPAPR